MEVCGVAEAIPLGLDMVRTGGTYVLAGMVSPGAHVALDAHCIVRKMIHLRGVHNYHPRHLIQALEFVMTNKSRFPFAELVDGRYSLDQVTQAMSDAAMEPDLKLKIIDRAINLEKIKQKIQDDSYGTGFFESEDA
jgi:threonine dehydrogenase-like Zn-dependent dehydrogenase